MEATCCESCLMYSSLTFFSQTEKNYSAQQSALVNSAYATLSKPYSRGLYLVSSNLRYHMIVM